MKKIPIILILLLQFLGMKTEAQSLVSISPDAGVAGQSVSVTVTGNGTSFGSTTQMALNMGTNIIPASNISVVSATVITATFNIPFNVSSGSYMLVANSGFTILQLPDAFTITGGTGNSATITSVSPNHGNKGETVLLNITGNNTSFTEAGNITVSLMGMGMPIIAPGAFAVSNTQLTCLITIPENASGVYSLIINTSNDGILVKPLAFTIGGGSNDPGIVSITPSTGARGQSLDVTITGGNTAFMQSSDVTVALFGSGSPITADFAIAMSNTEIWASISIPQNAAIGQYDVGVYTSNHGSLSLPSGFTVTGSGGGSPQLVSVAPSFGSRGQTLDVTITGANTSFMQGSGLLTAYMYDQGTGISANFVTASSATEAIASFTIPEDFPLGVYAVGIYSTLDGWLELANSFSIILTGVEEPEKTSLKAYPNPVKEILIFESEARINGITIMDLTGKQLIVPMENISISGEHTYSFNMQELDLDKGIYFLKAETDRGALFRKILVE